MAIELRAAGYRYLGATHPALESIDLRLEPGHVVGVVGANEAGKSTLCLVAAGLAPATIGGKLDGSVTIDSVETRTMRPHEVAQRCGILFQNPATQLSGTTRTVWEEIAFGPRNLGLPLAELAERVDWAIGIVRIERLAPRDPTMLSGGEAQLVALASVLALRPAYLVLDEPTSQLDPLGTRLVGQALRALARETGTGVLVVEHKADLLVRVAEQVVVLDRGRAVIAGPADAVFAGPGLEEHGVDRPSAVRVERALRAAGYEVAGTIAAAIAAAADADVAGGADGDGAQFVAAGAAAGGEDVSA
jgi:energy-coupling factor transporter ATP-binding protein EcfA2